MTTVAAVMLVYNQATWLPYSLSSITRQTRPPDQLIIIDDASNDGSADMVREQVARLGLEATFVAHDKNAGVSTTLNEAFALVDADLVATLPADDVWLPRRLQAHVEAFAVLPETVAAVFSDARMINGEGALVDTSFMEHHSAAKRLASRDLFAALASGNFIPAPAATVRMSAHRAFGPFDESLSYEDWDFWLRLAAADALSFHDEVVAEYRVLDTSLNRSLGHNRWTTDLRIIDKWWGRSPSADAAFTLRVVHATQALVLAQHPEGLRWAGWLAVHVRRPRALALLAMSRLPWLAGIVRAVRAHRPSERGSA